MTGPIPDITLLRDDRRIEANEASISWQALFHSGDGLWIIVDQHELAAGRGGHCSGRSTAGEKIEQVIPGRGRSGDDPAQDPFRFLGWVAGFFAAIGGDD